MFTNIKQFFLNYKYGLLIFFLIIILSIFSIVYSYYNSLSYTSTNSDSLSFKETINTKPVDFLTEQQKFELQKTQKEFQNNLPYTNFDLSCSYIEGIDPELSNRAISFTYEPSQRNQEIFNSWGCTLNTNGSSEKILKLTCKDSDNFIAEYLNYLSKIFSNIQIEDGQFTSKKVYDRLLISTQGSEYAEPLKKEDAKFEYKVYYINFGNSSVGYINNFFNITSTSSLETGEAQVTIPNFLPSNAVKQGVLELPKTPCQLIPLYSLDPEFSKLSLRYGLNLQKEDIQALDNYGVSITYILDAQSKLFFPVFTKMGYISNKNYKYLNNRNFLLGIFD